MKSPDRDAADELLPCPFCGSPAWFDDGLARGDHAAECTECRCSTKLVECNHDAAAIWNRRTEASELAALRRQVAEMMAALCDAHDQITQFKTEGYISCPSVDKIEAAVGKSASPLPPGRNEG